MIAVTGATGQLGRLVLSSLLGRVPAASLVAAVRSPEKAADLAAQGVAVRKADYSQPDRLRTAFDGVETLLLISSSEVGQRAPQHAAVIAAARQAGVRTVVYTSILHADRSPLMLAEEHRATEAELRASGLGWVLLRNGWYSENFAGSVPVAVEHGAVIGSSGTGKVSAASRADFAEAAAVVLADPAAHLGQTYELAGDAGFTKAELAAEIAAQSGKPVVYADMPEVDYAAALTQAGVPGPFAQVLADSDVGQSKGALEADGQVLSGLIGRPTQPMPEMVRAALAG
ncbi:SDR family oxidoreductase [Pseudooceanicola sp.]|uniref:SDR family oxidoreductase n=1 Tax=Pseudooceanicola sp. TaxID=1914328 RepID=UPI003517EEE9